MPKIRYWKPCFVLFLLLAVKTHAQTSLLRAYPYPYSNIISFSSDIDMQEPWFGEAFHSYFNEQLGLPVSDSVWVQSCVPNMSSIFHPNMKFNRWNKFLNNRSAFFLILQQWHRGNIDHIHGWQDDGVPLRILYDSDEGIILSKASLKVDINPVPTDFRSIEYTNIRFFFSEIPHDSFSIVLHDNKGHQVEISPLALKESLKFQKENAGAPICLNLIISPEKNPLMMFSSPEFSLVNIESIEFRDLSDTRSKNRLLRVEIDNFSRQTTIEQYESLEKFHVYPNLMTCHGGHTLCQDICKPNTPLGNKEQKCQADNLNSHGYHLDVLKSVGVRSIVPYDYREEEGGRGYNIALPPIDDARLFPEVYPDFYFLQRTMIKEFPHTFKEYRDYVKSSLKHVSDDEIKLGVDSIDEKDFDKGIWNFGQSVSFGTYILFGLDKIRGGKNVNHQWYTHFGTLTYIPALNCTPDKPLTKPIKYIARTLADHMYNIRGTKKPNERIWVNGASVYVRYFMVHPQVAKTAAIDFENSQVHIKSFKDKTTGEETPNSLFGTRDLHGLTFYVKNPKLAHIDVDGKPIEIFTMNPKDETGRASVTLVDDHLPTEILPSQGLIKFQGEPILTNMTLGGNDEGSLMLKVTQNGDSYMEFSPYDLSAWNTSHLYLDWSIHKSEKSQVFLEIIREDKQVVGMYESPDNAINCQAHWIIDPQQSKITLAQDQLSFKLDLAKLDSVPLVLGKIKKIRIGFKNAQKGDSLLIRKFFALRPSGNDVSRRGNSIVGGQVTNADGKPVSLQAVSMFVEGKKDPYMTSTDKDGYYVFFDIPKNSIISLQINTSKGQFTPLRGSKVLLLKDELEFNFKIWDR